MTEEWGRGGGVVNGGSETDNLKTCQGWATLSNPNRQFKEPNHSRSLLLLVILLVLLLLLLTPFLPLSLLLSLSFSPPFLLAPLRAV